MKQLLITYLFLCCLPFPGKATFCIDAIYQEKNINLYLCQNHSGFNEFRVLSYKAKTILLNQYIQKKIQEGKLQDKKFEIALYDLVLTYPHLEISQGKNGYYINMSGYPSLEYLVRLVDYFCMENWMPFFTGDPYDKNIDINKQMDNFYHEYLETLPAEAPKDTIILWQQESVKLQYKNDTLSYFVNDKKVPVEISSSLPVVINDRILFFERNKIYLMENEVFIKTIQLDENIHIYEDFDLYVYNDWVNICWGGEHNWLYSYCYSKNKFYKCK